MIRNYPQKQKKTGHSFRFAESSVPDCVYGETICAGTVAKKIPAAGAGMGNANRTLPEAGCPGNEKG
jgi:hypothetical protein